MLPVVLAVFVDFEVDDVAIIVIEGVVLLDIAVTEGVVVIDIVVIIGGVADETESSSPKEFILFHSIEAFWNEDD